MGHRLALVGWNSRMAARSRVSALLAPVQTARDLWVGSRPQTSLSMGAGGSTWRAKPKHRQSLQRSGQGLWGFDQKLGLKDLFLIPATQITLPLQERLQTLS